MSGLLFLYLCVPSSLLLSHCRASKRVWLSVLVLSQLEVLLVFLRRLLIASLVSVFVWEPASLA